MELSIIICILFISYSSALIGYDCNVRQVNVTAFSLDNDFSCHEAANDVVKMDVDIQLLQEPAYDFIHVFECKVIITRHVRRCGGGQWMVMHDSTPDQGDAQFIFQVSRSQCEDMHETGRLLYNNLNINNIRSNQTTLYPVTFAGVPSHGDTPCTGANYIDTLGSYQDVAVFGTVSITLVDYTSRVDVKKHKLFLQDQTMCATDEHGCINTLGSQAFWKYGGYQACDDTGLDVLYEGPAVKFVDKGMNLDTSTTMYVVQNGEIAFSLRSGPAFNLCGSDAYRTEHPKFKIMEKPRTGFRYRSSGRTSLNLDLFAYVNIKFTTFEKHVKGEIESLYKYWKMESCKQEMKHYKALRDIARISPEAFAYHLTGRPGYTAHLMGELIYVLQCLPVEVKVREDTKCWADFPITYGNKSMFLTPFNRQIISKSSKLPCNDNLSPGFRMGNNFVRVSPGLNKINNVNEVGHGSAKEWKYNSPYSLATSGIYSSKDLDLYEEQLINAHAHPVIVTEVMPRLGPIMQTLEEHQSLLDNPQTIVNKYLRSLWSWWDWIAKNATAIFGVYIFYRAVCLLLKWLFNGFSLYKKYGLSKKILYAPSTNLTNYKLRRYSENSSVKNDKSVELPLVINNPPKPVVNNNIYVPNSTLQSLATAPYLALAHGDQRGHKLMLNQV